MDFVSAAVTAALALTAGLLVFGLLRWQGVEHQAEINRLSDAYAGERDRLGERLKYLEFQLANHTAHVLKLPPPAPPIGNGPKPEPLPDVMQKFLQAIEDEEARLEFEGDFRARLALGADAHKVVAEAMSA